MDAQTYSYPPGVFAAFVYDVLLLRRWNFHRDGQVALENIAGLSPMNLRRGFI